MHHQKEKLGGRCQRKNIISSDNGFLPKLPEMGQSLSITVVMIFKKEKKNKFHENLYLQVTPFIIVTVTHIKEIYLLRDMSVYWHFPWSISHWILTYGLCP